jgi:hypothetical protein
VPAPAPAPAEASTSASAHWLDTDLGKPQQRRDRLPLHNGVIPSVNLWTLIRDWIGKDIHKLALPTHLNEPLTDLQRRMEAFEYSELIDEVRALFPHAWLLLMELADLHACDMWGPELLQWLTCMWHVGT